MGVMVCVSLGLQTWIASLWAPACICQIFPSWKFLTHLIRFFFWGWGSCLRCISRSQSRGTTADRSLACEDKLAFILVFFKHSAVKLQQLSSCLNSKQVVCASVQGFGVGVNFCSCHLLVEVCLGVARCLRSCHPWFTVFLPCCQ